MTQPPDVDRAVARIEALLDEFGTRMDARARAGAEELVRILMEVYGAGLSRVVELLKEGGEAAWPALDRIAADKLVASLLLIHGIHPVAAEVRIRRALERIARRLDCGLELVDVTEDRARIRVEGAPPGLTGERIEGAVIEAAPEIGNIEIEGLRLASGALVQIAL
jgi:hypothetical protein